MMGREKSLNMKRQSISNARIYLKKFIIEGEITTYPLSEYG
jgi:hypothetical protein